MTRPKSKSDLHPVERADLDIADTVAVDEQGVLGRILSALAEFGDQPPLRALSVAVFAIGLIRRDRRLARTGLRMLAAHTLATAAKGFVKDEVDRTRPGEALGAGSYKLAKGRSKASRLQSMPSGHSAGVAAVARAAAREYPQAAVPSALAAGTVMAAQLPSGNHFPSDIAVGAAIGLASEAIVAGLMGPPEDGPE